MKDSAKIPDVVKPLGAAATRGLQGKSLDDPLSVLACAKHYVGDGGTTFGSGVLKGPGGKLWPLDQGDMRVDEATLRKIHLQGYITAIGMGVGTIMPSYNSWNGVKMFGKSPASDRNSEAGARFRRLPDLRLQRAR